MSEAENGALQPRIGDATRSQEKTKKGSFLEPQQGTWSYQP